MRTDGRSKLNNKLSVCLSVCLSTYLYSCCSHLEHRAYVKRLFLNLRQSVRFLGRRISLTKTARYLHRTTQTQNKRTQISITWVGIEPTIPVFERAKTYHALERVATAIGNNRLWIIFIIFLSTQHYTQLWKTCFATCMSSGPVIIYNKPILHVACKPNVSTCLHYIFAIQIVEIGAN
jgi:hypothetical protein